MEKLSDKQYQRVQEAFGGMRLFEDFTDGEKERLLQERDRFALFPPGKTLIQEGAEDSYDFYILFTGRVKVKKEGIDKPLTHIYSGGIVGELAYLTRMPRTSSVIAENEVIGLRFDDALMAELDPALREKVKDQLLHKMANNMVYFINTAGTGGEEVDQDLFPDPNRPDAANAPEVQEVGADDIKEVELDGDPVLDLMFTQEVDGDKKKVGDKKWVDPVTGMEFLWIPPGSFMMGSPRMEVGRRSDEEPLHGVSLDGYWLSRFPVTQKVWRQVMEPEGENVEDSKCRQSYESCPVEHVQWHETQAFLAKLKELAGEDHKVRLPTEAEWEQAARAGKEGPFYFAMGLYPRIVKKHIWCSANSGGRVRPVGMFPPNPWGFHDMLGNVWEWVQDYYQPAYYGSSPEKNPTGPLEGSLRVRRGGCYNSNMKACRLGRRHAMKEENIPKFGSVGFRLARSE